MLLVRSLAASWLLLASAAPAQRGGDLQAQILYAYQTEDGNSLKNLTQELSIRAKADVGDPALRYHLAHAQYRRGLLADGAAAREAESAFSDCIDQLKGLVSDDVKSAEALVLQSACYAGLARYRRLESVLLRSRSDERLNSALKLEPHNPRAVFLSSMNGLARSKPGSAEQKEALAQLEFAVKLFDASPATDIDVPGWGHAESYLALGREMQARGDRLAARNWIEKSLIVAPDYKAAQRQLTQLARH
jgi:tetratricopeptide (TPR) repeat protein